MGSSGGLPASMEVLELKKYNATKAMLKLAVEWKSLDEQLDTIQKFLHEGQGSLDYEMKQKILRSQQDDVVEGNKKLSLGWGSLKLKLEELDRREEKFRSFHLAQVEEMKAREDKMEETRNWVVDRVKDFESREERLEEQKKSMEALLQKIEREKVEFMNIEESVGKKLDLIEIRERHCAEWGKELDSVQDSVCRSVRELESREKQVREREDKVELMQESNDQLCREHETNLKLRSDALDSVQDLLERKAEEVEEREKQIKAVPFNVELLKALEIKVQDQYKVLDTLQDLKGNWVKGLDLGGREIAISKFFGLQEKVYEYIREVIGKGHYLIAIRYVCLFDLGDEFPPATLLNEFVSRTEEAVVEIRKEGNFSLNAQAAATKKELNAIEAMKNCILAYDINSEYTVDSLEARIERLEKQKTDLELFLSSPPTNPSSQAISTFQTTEVNAEKHMGFVLEHDDKPHNQALSAEMLIQTVMPHQHLPLFPVQVAYNGMPLHCSVGSTIDPLPLFPVQMAYNGMPPHCSVGSTIDPLNLGKCGEFFPSGPEPGTQNGLLSLRWSSAWP